MEKVYGANWQVSSKHINNDPDQFAPYTINKKMGHFTLEHAESIIIEMFRCHQQIEAYWYNISHDGYDSITNLLDIEFKYFQQVMLHLDIMYYYGKGDKKQIRIRVNKLISWGENNGFINLEYDFYKPFKGTKIHYQIVKMKEMLLVR